MTLRSSRLNPKEKGLLEAQLTASGHFRRPWKGTIPPYAILPMLPFLPKIWMYQEVSGEAWLAEALRTFNNVSVVETVWDNADATIGAGHELELLSTAYATRKPFALLMPVDVLKFKDFQRAFQYGGIEIMFLDRLMEGRGRAWFSWALPAMTAAVRYSHLPELNQLPAGMIHPKTRNQFIKAAQEYRSKLATLHSV